jgi:Mg-chelatase subunit ChlD
MQFQSFSIQSHPEWATIHLKAPESESRVPIHLCCLIDTSGSMEDDDKLENVKRSLHYLLNFLGEKDRISVITFSSTAKTILSKMCCSLTEKENLRARIATIHLEFSTNLSAAVVEARNVLNPSGEALPRLNPSGIKQGILLLTDGMANDGVTEPADIVTMTKKLLQDYHGTSLSCIGYGTEHNAELLQSMATEGGGSYSIVNTLEDVATVFGNVLGGLISCSFQQVRITLPKNTEIKSRYAINQLDELEIMVGDLSAGMEAVVLAKIPLGHVLTVKGYDLKASQLITVETTVSSSEDVTIQTDGEAHYLRFDVLALLDDIASGKQTYERYVEMVIACTHDIKAYREKHAHALWDLLLNELDRALKSLKFPHMYHRNLTKQRGAYLGMMRGTSSQPADELPSNHYNVFSNGIQHTLSQELSREVTESFGVTFGTTTANASTAAAASFIEPTGGSSMSFADAVAANVAANAGPKMQYGRAQRKAWSHGGLSLARMTTCAMPATSASSSSGLLPESTFMWNRRGGASSSGISEDTMGQDGTQPGF